MLHARLGIHCYYTAARSYYGRRLAIGGIPVGSGAGSVQLRTKGIDRFLPVSHALVEEVLLRRHFFTPIPKLPMQKQQTRVIWMARIGGIG